MRDLPDVDLSNLDLPKRVKNYDVTNKPNREWTMKDALTFTHRPIRVRTWLLPVSSPCVCGEIHIAAHGQIRRRIMRCYWEQLGVLGPIYSMAGQGLSDYEIADRLKLTETTVHGCVAWLLHSFKCATRGDLVLCASPVQPGAWDSRRAKAA